MEAVSRGRLQVLAGNRPVQHVQLPQQSRRQVRRNPLVLAGMPEFFQPQVRAGPDHAPINVTDIVNRGKIYSPFGLARGQWDRKGMEL